ncbi:PAS domain S-box-containing protein [Bradyrhizobium sp. GM6.1]
MPETIAAEKLRQHLEDVARERDNAYRALQEREAELARIQRIGKVGGLEVDFREGFKNRRSPEYLMLHGLPPEAADESHEDWINRIHPGDRDATVKHFIEALSGTSEDYTAEYRIIRPSDGETRWIRVVAKIERDGGGRALRLVGAHIDVTDQMLVRETLRESEERFRLIADSAPVPIWVTKLDRTRSFANQAYVDFVGLPYDQAIAFDWRKVLHPDDLPHVLQQSVQGEASLKPFVLEARYKNAAGEWRWLRSESQPRWDPTGRHIGFIGVAHDITVAKQAEIELRQLNETLEERIAERTAELESNEARLRAILETSNQYQGLVNLRGELLLRQHDRARRHQGEPCGRDRKALVADALVQHDGRHERAGARDLRHRAQGRSRAAGDAPAPSHRRARFRVRHAPGARPPRQHHRRGARGCRHHRAPPRRGSVAAIAEDGGDRPAHWRRRARLQQSAHHHPLGHRFPAPPRAAGGAPSPLCRCYLGHRRACLQADRPAAGRLRAGSR